MTTTGEARDALAAQAFSALLGTRLVSFSPRGVTLTLEARPDLRQQDGFVHGGVISYLVDCAVTFAAGAVLGAGIVTGAISVDFLRPVTGDLTARARVLHAGRHRALARCEVTAVSPSGEALLCAVGQGSAVPRGRPRTEPA